MKVLLIDGYNLLHRARYGFLKGEYNIVFNFFRGLRSLVECIDPEEIVFVLEGYPKFRYGAYPEYKANRKITSLEKQAELADFRRQKDICIDILSHLPIKVVRHPDYEGDDVIGSLVDYMYREDLGYECVIATGDTDFIQILDRNNVSIYNPIKKEYVSAPGYDYVYWKSIVGDVSDNISGIKGAGPKTAEKVLSMTAAERESWFDAKPGRRNILERNKRLITFASVPVDELESLNQDVNFEYVKNMFCKMEFDTITSDKSWFKYINTFSKCL
jgi:5'-3' exonuclease